jgi:tight adherence protein B
MPIGDLNLLVWHVGLPLVFGAGVLLFFLGVNRYIYAVERVLASDILETEKPERTASNRGISRMSQRLSALDQRVAERGLGERIAILLTQSGIQITVSEFLLISAVCAVAGIVLLGILFPAAAVLGALLGAAPALIVTYLRGRRWVRLVTQLPEGLLVMSNALRAGHSFLQALEIAAREGPAPLRDELGRIVRETAVGVPIDAALAHFYNRVPLPDIEILITAVDVQRELGGNLAAILDMIAETIRDRERLQSQVRVLTAQVSLQAKIISLLPIFLLFGLSMISPHYFDPLTTTTIGHVLLAFGGMLILVGYVVMTRMTRIDV